MPVQTVTGIISKEQLGYTSPHEHIFLDLTNQYIAPDDNLGKMIPMDRVCMENLGILRRNPLAIRDNLLMDDYDTALSELKAYRHAGGGSIVEVTNIGLSRSPSALRAAAIDSGVQIIMGSGYYYAATHPKGMDAKTEREIADEIVSDVLVGVGETGVRSGVIGEIAVSERMHPNEAKVIRAAGMAQGETGLGVHIHIFDWPMDGARYPLGLEALDMCEAGGADLRKVAINHMDVAMNIDIEYCKAVLARGAYVQFDNFGHEFYVDKRYRNFLPGPFETDYNRVLMLAKLCEAGYEKQLLLACDICHKSLMHKYGGWGYDHVLTNIRPMLMDVGFDQAGIDRLLRDNPADFLDSDKIVK